MFKNSPNNCAKMKFTLKKINVFIFILITTVSISNGQAVKSMSSGEIKQAIKKLNVLGSVLYVAAHPDDENTRMIAYFANERLVETTYLSITRGDGGQNLVGTEKGAAMGVLRTQELLEARKIDGGNQMFTRAVDFGYSKSPEETMEKWDKDKVLSDVVWAIRKLKPDIIVNRFTDQSYGGHGHHTASAILAKEAFVAAADKKMFPEQLKFVDVWQVKRLYHNASAWWNKDLPKIAEESDEYAIIDVGTYNPLLGMGYSEMASESRSQHKSQGFGSLKSRGSKLEYLHHKLGDEKAKKDPLDNIDLSWSRVKGAEHLSLLLQKAHNDFNPDNPSFVIPTLVRAYKELNKLEEGFWVKIKKKDLQVVIMACAGMWCEITTSDYYACPEEEIELHFSIINRCDQKFKINNIQFEGQIDTSLNSELINNESINFKKKITIPKDGAITNYYWLNDESFKGSYIVNDQELIGLPANPLRFSGIFNLSIDEIDLAIDIPIIYKWRDRVEGELYRNFLVVPEATVSIAEKVYIFSNGDSQEVHLKLRASRDDVKGSVSLELPAGWEADPVNREIQIKEKGGEIQLTFKVTPPSNASFGEMIAHIKVGDKDYSKDIQLITYNHILPQTIFRDAKSKIVRLDVKTGNQKIGYIMGAGDEVPGNLSQLGYEVDIISEKEVSESDLGKYNVIITGIRVYNTEKWLLNYHDKLMKFVDQGGTMIVQYSTTWGLLSDDIGPYPFKISRDRVTVEEAKPTFTDPDHAILNTPNKITKKDFDGWVQERGLYFAGEWDEKFEAVISWHDPDEDPKDGSIIAAKYGKGHYVYTGISFFRQLPAGVPGAFKLFANLISLNGEEKAR